MHWHGNAKVDDPNRMRMTGYEFYMKTEEEMRALCSRIAPRPATTRSRSLTSGATLSLTGTPFCRVFRLLDPGETHESQFRRECEKGLRQHYGDDWETRAISGDVMERFEYEYKVICDKGFAAYFLIVAEYVKWAKENGIGVGPGRGSAAGAIVPTP